MERDGGQPLVLGENDLSGMTGWVDVVVHQDLIITDMVWPQNERSVCRWQFAVRFQDERSRKTAELQSKE